MHHDTPRAASDKLYCEYHFRCVDFVRGCAALLRKPLAWRLTEPVVWTGLILLLACWWLGVDTLQALLMIIVTGKLSLSTYLAAALVMLVTFFRVDIFCWLVCPFAFRKTAHANKTVYLSLDDDGLTGGTDALNTRVAWHSVQRLIITPHVLVFALSGREGLILPRRALSDDATCQRMLAFSQQAIATRQR